ncbi:protein amnionless isoform X2 [Octopus bimaculoides]|nr:protein amnionless isoform X2 [Octopus bimaculoides]|eukprot:XP_014768313.1 PREDICTED: protein amnionless-like [Octopus bimaculoides]
MELWIVILLLCFKTEFVDGHYKRWIRNTNFGNNLNWNTGRSPCGDDSVVIPAESPPVFININTTMKEIVFPKNGMLILNSFMELGFTSSPSTSCANSGQEVEFNATYGREWVDPANWCVAKSRSANCDADYHSLDSEKVPCPTDDVVFPRGNSYYIDLSTDMELTANSIYFMGQSFSTNTFSNFINSKVGKTYFKSYKPDENESHMTIRRRPCIDPASCDCGNYRSPIFDNICKMHSPFCKKPQCQSPVRPTGHCCNICGAILKCKYENGFSYDRLVDDIKKKFLQNATNVEFIVSRIDNDIQLTLMDITGEHSVIIGQKIYEDIIDDITHGGYKYIFSAVEIKVSGTPRNKRPSETTKTSTTLTTTTTKTPATVSSTTKKTKQTWTTATKTTSTTTTTTTTQRTSQKTTAQDYGKPESGRNIKVEPTGGFSTAAVLGFTLGSLILLLLIVILLLLYRRGNMRNFANPFTSGQFFPNIHSRFINQDTVPLDDLPSPTYHNEGGFQNPVYGAESTNRSASGGNTNNAYNNQEFNNPLYSSDLNQETLFDDPSRISPSLSLEPTNDPAELEDSTI